MKIKKEEIVFEKTIGAGSFASVWKGFWKGEVVAIKVQTLDS